MANEHPHPGELEQSVLWTVLRFDGEGYGAQILRELDDRISRSALYVTRVGSALGGLDPAPERWWRMWRDGVDESGTTREGGIKGVRDIQGAHLPHHRRT